MRKESLVIYIPVEDIKVCNFFYKRKIELETTAYDTCFLLPGYPNEIILNPIIIRDKEKKDYYFGQGIKRCSIFKFYLQKGFLSYTQKLVDNDVNFSFIMQHPGGYTAEVIDPFGNTFQYETDNFDVDETERYIDINSWPRYQRA